MAASLAACSCLTSRLQQAGTLWAGRPAAPLLLAARVRCTAARLRASATFPRDGFQYLSQEAAERIERERQEAWEKGLQEYADLKALLLKRTWRFGTLLALYLLLTTSAEAALCELVGAGASYGYLLLLFRDVDNLQPGGTIWMREAEKAPEGALRGVAKLLAGYRHALRPRLLVPVAIFAAIGAFNAAFPDDPLTMVEEGCAVGGFLAYKVALVQKIYDDLKPQPLSAEALMQEPRPALVQIEDVDYPWKKQEKEAAEGQGSNSSSGGSSSGSGIGGAAGGDK